MATPEVRNEHGIYRYSVRDRRWVCIAGRIPNTAGGLNCFVPRSYGSTLTTMAVGKGFSREDFGVVIPVVKAARVKAIKPKSKRRGPAPKKKAFKGVDMIFDLSA